MNGTDLMNEMAMERMLGFRPPNVIAEKDWKYLIAYHEYSPNVFFSWKADKSWRVEYVSESIRQFGYSPEQFTTGETEYLHIIHPADVERVIGEMDTHRQNSVNSFHQSYRILSTEKEVRWVDAYTVIERDRKGNAIRYLTIVFDITKTKQHELRLAESEEKFRSITENAHVGFFMYQKQFIYVNQAICDLTGYTRDELYRMNVLDLAHESSKEALKEIVRKRCRGEHISQKFHILKFLTKNGDVKTCRTVADTIPYKEGWVGFGTITEQEEANDKIDVLVQAVQQTDDMIRITDRNGIITFVNDATVKHLGYTHSELIGQTPRILKSGVHDQSFYQNLWQTILSGQTYREVVLNRKKDGTLYHESETITPILDDERNIKYFVVTGRDITERITFENMLVHQASTDLLTGAYNRKKLIEQLDIELDKFKRYHTPFAMILFDIDFFKEVNDQHGHDAGDRVLKKISELITDKIRKSDLFARWGGEEFIILVPEYSKENAMAFAEKLRMAIESFVFGNIGSITASFGVTLAEGTDTAETIIKRVDTALYRSKKSGRNQTHYI